MKLLKDLRVVFFGTPDFAVASLEAMIEAGVDIAAVVTAPGKPSGRGLQLNESPVKKCAVAHHIPVMQPEKLRDPQFVAALAAVKADVHVVVAFRMLPEVVWNMPPFGTINVHASLLPQYRGAAPINWAIINGEKESGVTTFRLKHEIDTGNLLLQEKVAILAEDNFGTLYEKLMKTGASLLVRTLAGLVNETIVALPQAEGISLKHAPKIFKEDTRIAWTNSAKYIHDFIRGLAPHPAAFTMLNEKVVKVYMSHYETGGTDAAAGTIDSDGKFFLRVAANDGWVYLDDVQQEGKKRMMIADFLRGYRF